MREGRNPMEEAPIDFTPFEQEFAASRQAFPPACGDVGKCVEAVLQSIPEASDSIGGKGV